MPQKFARTKIVAVMSFELQDLGEHFKMSCYMVRKYKQTSRQRSSIDTADQDRPRKIPLTGAERAKAFRDRRRADRVSDCQPSTSNVATAADSMMELHVEMRSADIDMDVNEPMGPIRHPRYGLRRPIYGTRNAPTVTHTSIVCF
jgi:hypothetical protein